MQDEYVVLNLAWNLAQHPGSAAKQLADKTIDNGSIKLVCELLLKAIKTGQTPASADLSKWTERIIKCPRTAGILLSGLSQIVSKNYKTHELRFKQLITTLVSRYEELFKNIRADDEAMEDGAGGERDDDEEEADEESGSKSVRAKQRRKQAAALKRKQVADALEAPSLLAIMPSPEMQIRRPKVVNKLTQDMSWLNDPQYIMDIAAVDSLIVEQFSQKTGEPGKKSGGGLESTFRNLLGSIAANEPFVIEEPADETFFHFNEELNRSSNRPVDIDMPEAKTPSGQPPAPSRVEEIHLHEKSASRRLIIGPPSELLPPPELPTKKRAQRAPTAGIVKIQKATSDKETSVEPLAHIPTLAVPQCSASSVSQNLLHSTPSFWQFACEFLSSGQNVVQTFAMRDRIASGLDATDWDVPAPPQPDDEVTVGRDSIFSFAPETDHPNAAAAETPQLAAKDHPQLTTPFGNTDRFPASILSAQKDSDIMTLAQQSLSVQSGASGSGAGHRAQALKTVLDTIFSRSREPVPWACVLPPSALRWQAAVCVGALLQLLAQNMVAAHQTSPFGSLRIGPAYNSQKRALEEEGAAADKENKKPRRASIVS